MVSNVDATEEEEELIRAIGSAQSNVLAAYVVLYRSLGMFKNVAIACMEELARRRSVGENFDYETWWFRHGRFLWNRRLETLFNGRGLMKEELIAYSLDGGFAYSLDRPTSKISYSMVRISGKVNNIRKLNNLLSF